MEKATNLGREGDCVLLLNRSVSAIHWKSESEPGILPDGEDGLRGVVGAWFGKKCEHRLDWFHVARRIARIEKEFLYLRMG